MATEDTPAAEPTMVDGGTPTPEEARLAAELANEGKPAAEPVPAAATPAPDGDDAAAAAAAAESVPTPAPTPAPTAAPEPPPREPSAPRDFDAAYKENQQKFDEGEIDADAFQTAFRAIAKDEAVFNTQLTIFRERQQTAAERAAAEFNTAAVAWQTEHKAFMDNPLYAQAMQQAIDAVDKQAPGLPAGELLQRAAKAAFEFTHYTPPAPVDKRAAIAAATAARKPGAVPATLGATPTGAHIDAPTGSAFANLDSLDIDNLENQLARMSPAQVEAYLADAPGARATGL